MQTEDQIENAVARRVDALDARFMNSAMTQAEYDEALQAITQWADNELRFVCPVFRHITGGN